MSTISPKARTAETVWRVRKRFQSLTLLELNLKTGRTHQIRVHCAALHHPIVGDKVYGPRKLEKTIARDHRQSDKILQVLKSVKRQMLHAWRLGFTHPVTQKEMCIESPVPDDMVYLMDRLRQYLSEQGQ
jgi:23S rRNA pseudouridine1911/1915/1917 synthase